MFMLCCTNECVLFTNLFDFVHTLIYVLCYVCSLDGALVHLSLTLPEPYPVPFDPIFQKPFPGAYKATRSVEFCNYQEVSENKKEVTLITVITLLNLRIIHTNMALITQHRSIGTYCERHCYFRRLNSQGN